MQRDQWTAVALDSQIQPSSSNPVIVDGEPLAVWRGEAGPVNIWEDRCPHRGMRLSFGFVRDNTLRCIYHGWGYAPDGQCTVIPAHPDLTPPKTICAKSYPSESRYGIVWTNLSASPSPFEPDLGAEESWQPVRSLYLSRSPIETRDALAAIVSSWGEIETNGDVITVRMAPDSRLLMAMQPVDENAAAIHVVAKGEAAVTPEARRNLARRLERLRNEIEAR